ncbi:MAG: hypothetical protein ACRDUV_21050 [Pseudonocardiaceae bacterium]
MDRRQQRRHHLDHRNLLPTEQHGGVAHLALGATAEPGGVQALVASIET